MGGGRLAVERRWLAGLAGPERGGWRGDHGAAGTRWDVDGKHQSRSQPARSAQLAGSMPVGASSLLPSRMQAGTALPVYPLPSCITLPGSLSLVGWSHPPCGAAAVDVHRVALALLNPGYGSLSAVASARPRGS